MRAVRFAILASFVSAAVLPTAAFAHPHVAGDPFSDVGDTIVAGSARLAPIRGPSHRRWAVTDVRGGDRKPAGTIEQQVARANTAAGRQWCVAILARDAAGSVTTRDSIWVSAGSPIPIYEWRAGGIDTFTVRFDGASVDTWWLHVGDRTPLADVMSAALFPLALVRLLIGQVDLAPGEAVALATLDYDYEGLALDEREAIQSAGETLLDHRGRARRCILFAVTPRREGAEPRTVWIDRATRAVLREEIRNESGDLLKVIDAE